VFALNQTIKIADETKRQLDKQKLVAREPYDSVIQRLLKYNANMKKRLET
jgi:predicted CopG family antitoxin